MITIDAAKQLLGRCPTHGRWILRDHRDPGLEQVRKEHIIEPDQRNAVMQIQLVQGATGADGQNILSGEECRRGSDHREHLVRRRFSHVEAMHIQSDQLGLDGDTLRP